MAGESEFEFAIMSEEIKEPLSTNDLLKNFFPLPGISGGAG